VDQQEDTIYVVTVNEKNDPAAVKSAEAWLGSTAELIRGLQASHNSPHAEPRKAGTHGDSAIPLGASQPHTESPGDPEGQQRVHQGSACAAPEAETTPGRQWEGGPACPPAWVPNGKALSSELGTSELRHSELRQHEVPDGGSTHEGVGVEALDSSLSKTPSFGLPDVANGSGMPDLASGNGSKLKTRASACGSRLPDVASGDVSWLPDVASGDVSWLPDVASGDVSWLPDVAPANGSKYPDTAYANGSSLRDEPSIIGSGLLDMVSANGSGLPDVASANDCAVGRNMAGSWRGQALCGRMQSGHEAAASPCAQSNGVIVGAAGTLSMHSLACAHHQAHAPRDAFVSDVQNNVDQPHGAQPVQARSAEAQPIQPQHIEARPAEAQISNRQRTDAQPVTEAQPTKAQNSGTQRTGAQPTAEAQSDEAWPNEAKERSAGCSTSGAGAFRLRTSRRQYLKNVEACLGYLHAGESYEMCLTTTMVCFCVSGVVLVCLYLTEVPFFIYLLSHTLERATNLTTTMICCCVSGVVLDCLCLREVPFFGLLTNSIPGKSYEPDHHNR
jgi:hypothetical protein